MNLLTASRLRAYRRCARYERLAYVDGWRSTRDADALHLGTLVHTGLEAWWKAHKDGHREGAIGDALSAVAGKGRDIITQIRAEELLIGYDNRWRDQTFEVVAVEDEFRAPLVNPHTMRKSRAWRLAGKVDARVVSDGRRLIVEHKTTSEDIKPGSDYWLKLQMDHQLSIYTIGAESLGWPPEGCLYDVINKPQHAPFDATPMEKRKYKKDGTLYANQHATDETPDEFRTRLRDIIAAEPERWFQRKEIPRTEAQLFDFLDDAWNQGASMSADHKAGRAFRNPDACHHMGRCAMWAICSAGLRPEEHPDLFRKLEHVHPELSEVDHAA